MTIKNCNLCITVPNFLSEDRLHDFEFKVGSSPDHMRSCGRYTGSTKLGQRIAVFCPANTLGQFVQLQIVEGEKNKMTPAEVLVWSADIKG